MRDSADDKSRHKRGSAGEHHADMDRLNQHMACRFHQRRTGEACPSQFAEQGIAQAGIDQDPRVRQLWQPGGGHRLAEHLQRVCDARLVAPVDDRGDDTGAQHPAHHPASTATMLW